MVDLNPLKSAQTPGLGTASKFAADAARKANTKFTQIVCSPSD